MTVHILLIVLISTLVSAKYCIVSNGQNIWGKGYCAPLNIVNNTVYAYDVCDKIPNPLSGITTVDGVIHISKWNTACIKLYGSKVVTGFRIITQSEAQVSIAASQVYPPSETVTRTSSLIPYINTTVSRTSYRPVLITTVDKIPTLTYSLVTQETVVNVTTATRTTITVPVFVTTAVGNGTSTTFTPSVTVTDWPVTQEVIANVTKTVSYTIYNSVSHTITSTATDSTVFIYTAIDTSALLGPTQTFSSFSSASSTISLPVPTNTPFPDVPPPQGKSWRGSVSVGAQGNIDNVWAALYYLVEKDIKVGVCNTAPYEKEAGGSYARIQVTCNSTQYDLMSVKSSLNSMIDMEFTGARATHGGVIGRYETYNFGNDLEMRYGYYDKDPYVQCDTKKSTWNSSKANTVLTESVNKQSPSNTTMILPSTYREGENYFTDVRCYKEFFDDVSACPACMKSAAELIKSTCPTGGQVWYSGSCYIRLADYPVTQYNPQRYWYNDSYNYAI
jgi:hypothetical protein